MGSQYAKQLIILFLNGKNDDVITNGAFALHTKFLESRGLLTGIVKVRKTSAPPQDELTRHIEELRGVHARIYLFGHGSLSAQTLGGFDLDGVAKVLTDAWPADLKVFRVSLIACRLAKVPRETVPVKDCVRSFAGRLFSRLGEARVESLTARIYPVVIVDPMAREHGELIWAADAGPAGQVRSLKVRKPKQLSLTDQAAQSVSKGMKTKVLFSWKNGQARARFYDYGKPKFKLPDLPREADDIAGLEDDYMDGMDQPDPNLRF